MSENEEFIREFLEECAENLDQLDEDLVALEKDPHRAGLLTNIFRTIHTVKGTSGFFGFSKLGAITHDGESLLGRLRDGELVLHQEIATALLKLVDAIRNILANIQDTGKEGGDDYQGLSAELIRLALSPGIEPTPDATPAGDAVDALPSTVVPAQVAETEPAPDVQTSLPRPLDENAAVAPILPSDLTQSSPTATTLATGQEPSPADREQSPLVTERSRDVSPGTVSEGSIRVDVGLLDELVDLTGELVLARNQLNQCVAASEDRTLWNTIQKLNLITSELQEGVMQTRMQPMAVIWGKFPRLIRDLALGCKKEVRLEQVGEDTELDRSLLEAIKDPLTHLVRNAVDHGIELPAVRESRGKPREGQIQLRAFHEGGQVHIEITDDGGGIDLPRIQQRALDRGLIAAEQAHAMDEYELSQLIFLPGFSTAEKVTEVSGRGVGMDVVRTNIEQIGGTVDLQNRPGSGTTVRITIPLTLAIIPALIVACHGALFAIPQVNVVELVRLSAENAAASIERVHEAPVFRSRGRLLPLVYLRDVLQLPPVAGADDHVHLAILRTAGRCFGLVVDEVNHTQDIVVKPMGRALQGIPVFAGATILGDGTVALILDLSGMCRSIGLSPAASGPPLETMSDPSVPSRPVVLCELAGGRGRIAIALEDVERLEEFPAERLERAAGQAAVQYDNTILPLIDVATVLHGGQAATASHDPVTVVVGRVADTRIGLIVSRILDIVDCTRGTAVVASEQSCVAESVVIAHCITDVLDYHAVIKAAALPPIQSTAVGLEAKSRETNT